MLQPDGDSDNHNNDDKDQSSLPIRKFQYQHQRKDAIETTSQMHSLDYNNDLQDEYYSISTTVPKVTQQYHERASFHNANQNRSPGNENLDGAVLLTNGKASNSGSNKSGWFSLPWSNNIQGRSQHHRQQQQQMISINEEPTSDINHNNRNDDVDDINPSSPKRRGRKFNVLENPMMMSGSYRKVTTTQPNHIHDNNDYDDTTTTRSDIEYSSLQEPPPPSTSISTSDPQDDCSFFFRSDESHPSRNNAQKSKQQQQHHHHEWKTIRRDHYKLHNSGQSIMYEYSDAVAVTPMPILQQYRTKFAQLNSELITERGSRRHREPPQQLDQPPRHYRYFDYNYSEKDHHHVILEQQRDPFDDWHMQQSSLQLQEYDTADATTTNTAQNSNHEYVPESLPYYNANDAIPRTGVQLSTLRPPNHSHFHHGIVRSDTARQSSLFFMADGRMLMRLPRDRVRLLVDPDLEVGVLSVEQCRVASALVLTNTDHEKSDHSEKDTTSIVTDQDRTSRSYDNENQGFRSTKMDQNELLIPLPELRYVLTVSDDLYRKIVEEMSPTGTKYFCCTRGCCNDEEKVDIRIAFFLFGSTLLILFINMLAFREH